MKNIVVGVDGSETAATAARVAAQVARAFDARLYVVSAFGYRDVQTFKAEGQKFSINHKEQARLVAEESTAALRAEFPELDIVAGATEGRPAEALVDTAEKISADLIVVGNKRVQGAARVLGSVATAVAQRAHCDVYIAHTVDR